MFSKTHKTTRNVKRVRKSSRPPIREKKGTNPGAIMSGRYSQLTRVFTILGRLEGAPHGLTAIEIHERIQDQFKVDVRTVYRDLEALEMLGFTIFPDQTDRTERSARWKVTKTLKVGKTLNLNYRELVALYVARKCLDPFRDTPLYKDLESVFSQIETFLGGNCWEYLRNISSEIQFEPGPRWGLGISSEVLDAVQASCEEHQVLSVSYSSVNSGTTRERRLGPHFIYFAKGSFYLVAEDLEDRRVKVFALPRMSDAKMLDLLYEGKQVDPEAFFETAFGVFCGEKPEHIVLEFNSPIAASVRERRWHPSQRTIPLDHGRVRLTLDVAITPDLIHWILGFGEHVTVLGPTGLIHELIGSAQAILDLYSKKAA
ncbi:WYL domain-containing transcriptional regulator [Bdellovibrionota bacterium FG-2]